MQKVVAITGATRGIGRAIARFFHERNHLVAVCSRSVLDEPLPSGIIHCQIDVRLREDQSRFVSTVVRSFGRLDVFVNNAGISRWRSIEEVDEKFTAEIIETNLLGTLWGCAAAAGTLPDGGCIINVSSLAGKRGSANNSVYCATKFAVNGITQALARELGPRGIRVNAVCPVYVATDRIIESLAEPSSPAGGAEVTSYLDSFAVDQTALGRLPTALEVARVVYFLASEEASAITGQCVNVDCGTLPQ